MGGGEITDPQLERRDASNLTLTLTIGYVSDQLGEDAVPRLLALAGETRPLEELLDERRWSTQEQKIALFRAAAELTGDPKVTSAIGRTVLMQQTGTALRVVLRTVGSPAALARSVTKASAKFATNYTCEAIAVGRNDAVITNRLHPGYEPDQLDCDYTHGLLSQIPAVFGLPTATISHQVCQVQGADACEYRLQWRSRSRLPWRRGRAEAQMLAEQLELLSERHEALQSTVIDLVSPDAVDAVLARIIRRAADAVRAQAFVLALSDNGDEPLVHQDGLTPADAMQVAREVLAPIPDDHGGSRLIADVVSARHSYGRLVALCAPGHSFFPEERNLLATYARQAAVALDAATALDEARQRGATAQSLLDLAGALARTTTTTEVAQALADAVPQVTGAQTATVMLWEPDRSQLRIHARSGADAPGPGEAPDAIRLADSPVLQTFLTSPVPVRLDLKAIKDPFLRGWMEATGVVEALVVPIFGNGEFIGAISAQRLPGHPPLPEQEDLAARLSGLADQAAVALAKVQLLEKERDSVRRLQQEEGRIKHLAYHDVLTGLPNGRKFGEELDAALRAAKADKTTLAVLFCDLDRFKTVNDSLGHVQGDELLRLAAARLATCTRGNDVLARLGGDEFTVLLRELEDEKEATAVADRILENLRHPFVLGGQEVFLSVSVGIAFHPDDGTDAQSLMKNADAAMYKAKSRGRDGQVRYRADMNARARHLLSMEADLHNALAREELEVHYQPQVDADGLIVAVEALARWPHPELGEIPPSEFIPLAEESGLIIALDDWVLLRACRQARAWQDQGCPPVRVAVNMSAHQVVRTALPGVVASALRSARLRPELLELEVTETAAMGKPDRVAKILQELRRTGIQLAVDDYGTGYSMLGHLKDFPIDRLKIDRSFVAGLPDDRHDRAIVSTTISLAHELGMQVTAEGVERADQAAFLLTHGCDALQGYLYARAMSPAEIGGVLRASASLLDRSSSNA